MKFVSPEPMSGCWLWTGAVQKFGHGRFHVAGENKMAHRISYEIANGPVPEGLHVLHKCDTPCCVNPDHLFLGTNLDNIADKVRKGRTPAGAAHPCAKLSAEAVAEIKRASRRYGMGIALAKKYNVSLDGIYDIRDGRRRAKS